jgi:hypothetical protein
MEGSLKRYRERQRKKALNSYSQSMMIYESVLDQLVNATGNGKSYRQDNGDSLVFRLKPNELYAIRCPDNEDYYRVVMIKRNQLNNNFQTLISNPTYGVTPPGMQEVSQEQLFKQMKEMNASLTLTDTKAFPYNSI